MARTRTRCSSAIRSRAQQNISEATAQKIDAEIRRLVEAGYAEARTILEEKRADLETLAKGLLEFETLSGDEIKDLLAGKRPVRESVIEPATPRSSAVPSAGKGRPPRPDAPLDPQPAAAGVSSRHNSKNARRSGGRFALCATALVTAPRPAPAARVSICFLRVAFGLSVSPLRRSAIASSLRLSARITAARLA